MTRRLGLIGSTIVFVALVAAVVIFLRDRSADEADELATSTVASVGEDRRSEEFGARRTSETDQDSSADLRDPADSTASADRTVTLLDEKSRPLIDHFVAIFSAKDILFGGRTDGEGRFSAPPARDGEIALVVGHHRAPTTFAIPRESGNTVVTVATGAVLAGKVLMDGVAPRGPIDLRAASERSFWHPLALPSHVRDILKRSGFAPDHLSCATDAGGAFRFAGLLPGDDVMIDVRSTHLVERESGRAPRLLTESPNENLVIDLVSIPQVFGRLVAEDDRSPIDRAQFVVSYTPKGGNAVSGLRATTAADGKFSVPVARGTVKFEYEVRTAGGAVVPFPARTHVFDGDLDLGDIPVPRDQVVEVVLKNDLGAPIVGGFAYWKGAPHTRGDPTDANGMTRLTLKKGGGTVRASALGHESVESQPIDVQPASPIELVLDRANRLKIGVAANVDVSRLSLSSRILCERSAVFPTAYGEPEPGQSPRSYRLVNLSGLDAPGVFVPLRDGSVVIGPVKRGAHFLIAVTDDLGHELGKVEYDMPMSGDGEVVVPIRVNTSRIVGEVTDAAGRPLAGAVVTIQAGGPGGQFVETADDGRFAFDGSFAAKVTIAASLIGYLSQSIADVVVASGEPVRFKLTPARSLTVTVKDGDGLPFDRTLITATWPGGQEIGARFGRAQYRFSSLPEGIVQFSADVFGDITSTTHRTEEGDFTMQVPNFGEVTVGWSSDLPSGQKATLRAEAKTAGATSKALPLTRTQLSSGVTVALPPLLPGDYEVYLEATNPTAGGMIAISEKTEVRVLARRTVEVILTVR